ncbi:hypothetical protein WJX79_009323 [Trebouxia sp. C0005]|nr:MAG: DNA-directed RNA polymerase II subunit RPB11-like [Trebouxia sp. A1-2]
MNAPDRYEKFVVPEGLEKISHEKDTKVPHAATFTIQREDHTIGNIVRMQLHRDNRVNFAGYKVPHPLEYRMLIKVQTNGDCEPKGAMQDALKDLQNEFSEIHDSFMAEVQRVKQGSGGAAQMDYR